MDTFLTFEIDKYGIMLDTYWLYISLSWQIISIAVGLIITRRIFLKRKNRF